MMLSLIMNLPRGRSSCLQPEEELVQSLNSQAATICKQLLLFHVRVQFWTLPRGRTGVGAGWGVFCKKLINDTQLQS